MEECIVRTLSYFDIFDYPLTFSEIKKYLCCKLELTDDDLYELLGTIPVVQESEGYYYLLGRSKLASLRSERYNISMEKHAKARVIVKILSFIPTLEYIGISGSLSMNNAANSDDIDLFFITKKNTLWISRFIVNLTLGMLKQKRSRNGRNFKNKICPNMFMCVDKLSFGTNNKTLYEAHEIIQVNTVFDRIGAKELLLSKNKWVKDFFPNISIKNSKRQKKSGKLAIDLLKPFEKMFYLLQRIYMGKKKGSEKIGIFGAQFHPINRQKLIMDVYKLRSKRYLELLSDNLWIDSDDARFYMDDKKIRILN